MNYSHGIRPLIGGVALSVALACPSVAGAAMPLQEGSSREETRESRSLVIYDVRDLLPSQRAAGESRSAENRAAPRTEAIDDADPTPAELDGDCGAILELAMRQIVASLDEGATVEWKSSGALVVRARDAAHEAINEQLFRLRTGRAPLLEVETRIFSLDGEARAALKRASIAPGTSEAAADDMLLSSIDSERFVELIKTVPHNELQAPRLTIGSLKPFAVAAGSDYSYVARFDQVAIEGMGTIADPVIERAFDGLRFHGVAWASPTDAAGASTAVLRLRLLMSSVRTPFRVVDTDLGKVQLPEVAACKIQTTHLATVGKAVLLGGIPKPGFDDDSEARLYLLVTVRHASGAWSEGGAPADPAPTKRGR